MSDAMLALTHDDDRRIHPRRPLRVNATLTFSDQQQLTLPTLDISWGGVGLVCEVNPPLGIVADLRLGLPAQFGQRLFDAQCQFIRSVYSAREDGFVLGLRFINIAPHGDLALANFLRGR